LCGFDVGGFDKREWLHPGILFFLGRQDEIADRIACDSEMEHGRKHGCQLGRLVALDRSAECTRIKPSV
jgi:hypothetical protein